jgi:hypothetical protein
MTGEAGEVVRSLGLESYMQATGASGQKTFRAHAGVASARVAGYAGSEAERALRDAFGAKIYSGTSETQHHRGMARPLLPPCAEG